MVVKQHEYWQRKIIILIYTFDLLRLTKKESAFVLLLLLNTETNYLLEQICSVLEAHDFYSYQALLTSLFVGKFCPQFDSTQPLFSLKLHGVLWNSV